MKVTAIIQARMTSSRLPGKILMEVMGKPLLQLMIERTLAAECVDSVVLATTDNPEDDPTEKLGRELGVKVFRGSEDDVLGRFYQAAKQYGGEHIMRLTGDCPLIDPDLLDQLADFYFNGKFDFASNCEEPTLPDGLDAEILSFKTLEEAHAKAERPSHREHVTLFVCDHPEMFKIGSWLNGTDYSSLRWTVDNAEDFEAVKAIIERLLPVKQDFRMMDAVNMIRNNPEITAVNSHINRNEGLAKSLAEEME
ncbi:glycosyltransferase family protein [Maridesulfovibrio sp.]|uniref:glycosyltransferase family protein n=1 Tax=Maridesulfovibrio sp. TaxID=2795000 RepID=UPI0029CA4AD6|nr:glycosyltransferase family protein [Maridesulfovibrio sp.]